jgi:hypothetical protein
LSDSRTSAHMTDESINKEDLSARQDPSFINPWYLCSDRRIDCNPGSSWRHCGESRCWCSSCWFCSCLIWCFSYWF